MGYPLKKGNTTRNLVFLMIDSTDHITGKAGLSPTVRISKNGSTGTLPVGSITVVDATYMPGWYQLAANAADADTFGSLVLHATATGADPCDVEFNVVSYDPDLTLPATALNNAAAIATDGSFQGSVPLIVKS
ncbi:MAG: hypothetical protein WCJ35_28415 [Planctomycetota bacterium]